ncbi:DUF6036 family nucleotidyltransferase [Verrucomicrobiales bacterium BCK34]|nr:DUF6036 family nucleotidyltransferase [Verrucomicrobiales bacterium BCK34]
MTSLLQLLGDFMDAEGTPDLRLVVSGGAALIANGTVNRSTHDLDVFAQRDMEGDLKAGNPLPDWFLRLVKRVAKQEALPENWINSATSLVMDLLSILPSRCFQNLEECAFGNRLRVSFLKREAQIFLKVYACFGRVEERDRTDLKALSPSSEELELALARVLKHDLVGEIQVRAARHELEGFIDGN